MPDPFTELHAQFEPNNRWARFGNVIMWMQVEGFRCHANTILPIQSPITAICGLNGTGKTTLLQAAALAYQGNQDAFKGADFFAAGGLDPNPFADQAKLTLRFWKQDQSIRQLTIKRRAATSRWGYHKNGEARHVEYLGINAFLPSYERNEFVFKKAQLLNVTGVTELQGVVREKVSGILGNEYTRVEESQVAYRQQQAAVLRTTRGQLQYSEAHMGCGEARIHVLVKRLEALPQKSLVLLEEPEISLHQSVQYRFGWYLADLCKRKGHQVLVSTHSDKLIEALDPRCRVFLNHRDGDIDVITGLSSGEVRSILSDRFTPALTVLVEDEVARTIVQEIVRRIDQRFLQSVRIVRAGIVHTGARGAEGGKQYLRRAMTTLHEANLPVAAVIDEETGLSQEDRDRYIYALPCQRAPERQLLDTPAVLDHLRTEYAFDYAAERRTLRTDDTHGVFDAIAERVNCPKEALLQRAAAVFARALNENQCQALVEQLKDAARRTDRRAAAEVMLEAPAVEAIERNVIPAVQPDDPEARADLTEDEGE